MRRGGSFYNYSILTPPSHLQEIVSISVVKIVWRKERGMMNRYDSVFLLRMKEARWSDENGELMSRIARWGNVDIIMDTFNS